MFNLKEINIIFILFLMLYINIPFTEADVPFIVNVEPILDGMVYRLVISVQHNNPSETHYLDCVEVDIDGNVVSFNCEGALAQIGKSILRYSCDANNIKSTSIVKVRAHCTVHGWSTWVEKNQLKLSEKPESGLLIHNLEEIKNADFYVIERKSETISAFSRTGERIIVYRYPELTSSSDINIDLNGDLIVAESGIGALSKISLKNGRTEIIKKGRPTGFVIDSEGNYIIAEYTENVLTKVTREGSRVVLYNFNENTNPIDVVIDSDGNYVVLERGAGVISKISKKGVRTVIYNYEEKANGNAIIIDSQGNYITTEYGNNVLSKITPNGVRNIIYNFNGKQPFGVVIDDDGNYVVTLTFENEIVKITPTGTFTSLYKYQENEQPYAITKIHIITENPPSGSSSENGGIPGFPLEAMFIGFVIIMIFRLRKYSG